jgi:glycosyltransferase involved in cell wall biosynthesis
MKIALVCSRYPHQSNRIENNPVRVIAECLAAKNDVAVFTLASSKDQVGIEIVNGIRVQRKKSMKLSDSLELPTYTFELEIKKFEPDIIHAFDLNSTIPYFACTALDQHSRLVITPSHDGKPSSMLNRVIYAVIKPYLNRALTEADKIVCFSAIEREMLERAFSVGKDKTVVVANGADSSSYNSDNQSRLDRMVAELVEVYDHVMMNRNRKIVRV